MKPSTIIDSHVTPDQATLECVEHDGDLFLYLNRQPLTSSRAHEPETALARIGCGQILRYRNPLIVIAGLGLGYTLQEVLSLAPPKAEILVVEPLSAIVKWNQTLLGDTAAAALRDPRVQLQIQGLVPSLKSLSCKADAILLALDPGLHAQSGNSPFSRNLLQECAHSLNPRGSISVRTAREDVARITSILTGCRLATSHYATAARSGGRTRTHAIVSAAQRNAYLPAISD